MSEPERLRDVLEQWVGANASGERADELRHALERHDVPDSVCEGCGTEDPSDQVGDGHVAVRPVHVCGGVTADCAYQCPGQEQFLCGPIKVNGPRSKHG